MGSRLDRVTDWDRIAKDAGYRGGKLADLLEVDRRQLNRYFHLHFNISAEEALQGLRIKVAEQLLNEGKMVKEVADELGYKNPTDFSYAFTRARGLRPTEFRRLR